MTPPDLLTVGRISVDLYAEQLGAPLTDVTTFRKSIGGTSTNVAVAAARLGHRVATWTRVGDDELGAYALHALDRTFGVDISYVGRDPHLRTPLAIAVLDPPDDPQVIFYREPRAPDLDLDVSDVPVEVICGVSILWVPASRFADPVSRAAVTSALLLRERRVHTIIDLDWRHQFWESEAAGTAAIAPMLDHFTLAVGNRRECRIATGTDDPDLAADRLLDRGLDAAIVKLGADGVLVATSAGVRQRVAPFPVEVLCGLGAGDAFGGALCHGLLEGWDLERSVRYANAAGAIVASRLMCADDMPTAAEVDQFLEDRSDR